MGKHYIDTKAINTAHVEALYEAMPLENFTLQVVLQAKRFSIQTDVIRVLQGKLEGCTVNSQGVILNHTTYYLNPDAHIFN